MADSASHISKPSESDFHDSHPRDEDVSPTLSELSGLDSLPDTDDEAQSVGDIASVATPDEDDVLGDITLLEEAFAEMDEDASSEEEVGEIAGGDSALEQLLAGDSEVETPEATSEPAIEEFAAAEEDDANIPVLNEAVSEPTSGDEPDVAAESTESIPTLEDQATGFENIEVPSDGDSALEQLLEVDTTTGEMVESEASADASVFVEAEPDILSNAEQMNSKASAFSEITAGDDVETAVDVLSDSDIEDVDMDGIVSETVDDKVAQMTTEEGQSEINEIPSVDPLSGISTEFAENLDSTPLSTVISTIEDDEPDSQPTHAEHQVSVGNNSGFSLNIPFELHSQLSKKIDELVIDATTSLTNELNDQLSNKLEELLEKSVEAVLPALANQMVNGLRGEIKQRVNDQLPLIINDVLGKTSLKDK